MGKSKIEYITKHGEGPDAFFCVRYASGAQHHYAEMDLPKTARLFWENANILQEIWCDEIGVFCEYASNLDEEPSAKIEAFYTGGGIWLCGTYLDENIYVCTDNCDFEEGFYIYDHREEDDYSEYPCQNVIGSKVIGEMNHEEIQLYNALRKVLLRDMC